MRIAMAIMLGLLVLLSAISVRAEAAKQATDASFSTTEKILSWISNYRFDPEPKKLPSAVKAMRAQGLIRDPDKSGVYIGFIAGVLGANQQTATRLVAQLFPMPPEQQPVIIRAIAYSDLPDWKRVMKAFIERMPARRRLVERYLYDKEPTLFAASFLTSPSVLDAHWGYYFATGLYRPAQRIIDALEWSTHKTNVQKLTIGSMAKWTLATNASRDKDLLDLCRQELELMPKAKRPALTQVVQAAQSYETTKIRNDAIAAIEKLKANPNPKSQKWYSAANLGSTALALGCVVASATGHAELAVPCIITGAVSSAGLKLWQNGTAATLLGGK